MIVRLLGHPVASNAGPCLVVPFQSTDHISHTRTRQAKAKTAEDCLPARHAQRGVDGAMAPAINPPSLFALFCLSGVTPVSFADIFVDRTRQAVW